MATTTNPGQTPAPEPQPVPPQPAPQPRPTPDPANPGQQPRTPDGREWKPPPPPTPTQEELDAMAEGNYDPLAPEGQRVKRKVVEHDRSMESDTVQGGRYPTR